MVTLHWVNIKLLALDGSLLTIFNSRLVSAVIAVPAQKNLGAMKFCPNFVTFAPPAGTAMSAVHFSSRHREDAGSFSYRAVSKTALLTPRGLTVEPR